MKPEANLIIINAAELLTISSGSSPKTRGQMDDLGIVNNGAVAVSGKTIITCGTTDEVLDRITTTTSTVTIDATDKVVMPGFVDCHTHLVFAGSRAGEFEQRIKGRTYLDILRSGGGILNTVKATRAATEESLIARSMVRLDTMMRHGTTTIEAKSGYGLTLEDEHKQLRVVRALADIHKMDIIPTFLVHTTPPEFKNPDDYIDHVISDMLPGIRSIAEFCDIFCEQGVFDIGQSEKVMAAAKSLGFKLKIHADQMTDMGGARLAARLNAVSASHLDHISSEGIDALAAAGTVAVLLPGASFFLGSEIYPPASRMISRGAVVALSTDFNPGSCPTESMQIILTLACIKMKMTPAQAINAATINAAHAIDRADIIGSLDEGKQADIIILDTPDHRSIPYHFGVNNVQNVIKKGKVVA